MVPPEVRVAPAPRPQARVPSISSLVRSWKPALAGLVCGNYATQLTQVAGSLQQQDEGLVAVWLTPGAFCGGGVGAVLGVISAPRVGRPNLVRATRGWRGGAGPRAGGGGAPRRAVGPQRER